MPALPALLRAALVTATLFLPVAHANILDEQVVDFIVVEHDESIVYLDIVQQLPWTDDTYRRLDRKVDNYVRYVRSGALVSQHPEVAGKAVAIRVVYVAPPGPPAVWRLEAVKSRIKPRGVNLVWIPLAADTGATPSTSGAPKS